MTSVVAKLFPHAAKVLEKEVIAELVIGAGVVGGATNFVIDKGFEAAKNAATNYAAQKKAELEQHRAALLEQKTAEPTKIMEFPKEDEKVEKEDKKASKKNK